MSVAKLCAAGYDIHFFEAEPLRAAIDSACDLPTGKTMEYFDDLMILKYQEIPQDMINDLGMMGIETPILIDVELDGAWNLTDGHHRLAWALVHEQPVPVIFVDDSIDSMDLWVLIPESNYDYS